MDKNLIRFQGVFELFGISAFLGGYFGGVWWLMLAGGAALVLDDVVEIAMGILNPLFPILLALVLVVVLDPWYVGIFWASAVFKIFNIPTALLKVFAPERVTRLSGEALSG